MRLLGAGQGWSTIERVTKYIQQSELFADVEELATRVLVFTADTIGVVQLEQLPDLCKGDSPIVVVPLEEAALEGSHEEKHESPAG